MGHRVEDTGSTRRSGEDSGWEFRQREFAGDRPTRPTGGDRADAIAAFAKAARGVVLAGGSEYGSVIGLSPARIASPDPLRVEVGADAIEPRVRILTRHKVLSNGEPVLLAEVPESEFVHESPGGSRNRVDASKRLRCGNERLRLAPRRSQDRISWSDKQTVPGTGFKTLAASLQLRSAPGERLACLRRAAGGKGSRAVPAPRDIVPEEGPRGRRRASPGAGASAGLAG